jgi:hypothetical protein
MESEIVKTIVNEKEYEVKIIQKDGKFFAKTHINFFGEITIPDFGGGHEGALQNLSVRISNIVKTLQMDEAREARRRAAEAQAAAVPVSDLNFNNFKKADA